VKVSLYDQIKTVVNVKADFSTHETSDEDNSAIPKGTLGTVVECYENPEGYAVDIAFPMKG
jgi:hypothetical protein